MFFFILIANDHVKPPEQCSGCSVIARMHAMSCKLTGPQIGEGDCVPHTLLSSVLAFLALSSPNWLPCSEALRDDMHF
jgi:hypothetical protein